MEVKAKTYYGLKMMARNFFENMDGERILMHMQNAPMYYAKYKNEESKVKALMELIKRGVAVNMRSVTLEHCFGVKKQRKLEREKHQDGSSVPLRKEKITRKPRYP